MITVDQIMATWPCSAWPRARVAAAIAALDCSSWTAAAESARAGGWSVVSLADLRLTAYRAATPAQRIAGVRRSIRVRIDAQIRRWPEVDGCIAGVRAELRRWCAGDDTVDLPALRAAAAAYAAADAADAAYSAAEAAANAAYAFAAAAAAESAAYAYDAYVDADAADAEAWAGLLFVCRLLDFQNRPDHGADKDP